MALEFIKAINLEDLGKKEDVYNKSIPLASGPLESGVMELTSVKQHKLAEIPLNEHVDFDDIYEEQYTSDTTRGLTRPTADFDGNGFNSFFANYNKRIVGYGFSVIPQVLGTGSVIRSQDSLDSLTEKQNSNVRKSAVLKQWFDIIDDRIVEVRTLSGTEPAHNKLTPFEQFNNEQAYHKDLLVLALALDRVNQSLVVTQKMSQQKTTPASQVSPFTNDDLRDALASASDLLNRIKTPYGDLMGMDFDWTRISSFAPKQAVGTLSLIVPHVQFSTEAAGSGNFIRSLFGDAMDSGNPAGLTNRTNWARFTQSIQAGFTDDDYRDDLIKIIDYITNNFDTKHKAVKQYYRHLERKTKVMQEKMASAGDIYGNLCNYDLAVNPKISLFVEFGPHGITGDDGGKLDVISLIRHDLDKLAILSSPHLPSITYGDMLESLDFVYSGANGAMPSFVGIHVLSGLGIVPSKNLGGGSVGQYYYIDVSTNAWYYQASTSMTGLPDMEVLDTISVLTEKMSVMNQIRESFRIKFLTSFGYVNEIGDDSNILFPIRNNQISYKVVALKGYAPIYRKLANNVLPDDFYGKLGKGFHVDK